MFQGRSWDLEIFTFTDGQSWTLVFSRTIARVSKENEKVKTADCLVLVTIAFSWSWNKKLASGRRYIRVNHPLCLFFFARSSPCVSTNNALLETNWVCRTSTGQIDTISSPSLYHTFLFIFHFTEFVEFPNFALTDSFLINLLQILYNARIIY